MKKLITSFAAIAIVIIIDKVVNYIDKKKTQEVNIKNLESELAVKVEEIKLVSDFNRMINSEWKLR